MTISFTIGITLAISFEPEKMAQSLDWSYFYITKLRRSRSFAIGSIQNEFYAAAFRKKVYSSLEKLQEDVDKWILEYNENRTHTGKYCFGPPPCRLLEGLNIWP